MKEKFVVDGMLGTLARKLRIFGYDTIYDPKMGDEEIFDIAIKEYRTVLTSDRAFYQNVSKKKVNCVLLTEESDEERMCTVLKSKKSEVKRLSPDNTRCSICNGEINQVVKSDVSKMVPEGVFENQEKFYRCVSCGKIYWIGGHWRHLYTFSEEINKRIQQT